jgi:solute carrier family 25 (mitochondrial oxoglutarate transporter), member 11
MSTQTTQPRKIGRAAQFGTACCGGVAAWWVVHPFNTAAVRMSLAANSGPVGAKPLGTFPFISGIVKAEGFGALYNGLGAATLRQVFYATSRFGLFEVFRDKIAAARNGGDASKVDFTTRFFAGMTSGGMAAIISMPAEVTTVRMSNDAALPAAERRNYKSVVDAFARIVREEGALTFWSGATPYATRCMVVGICQVGTYDQFKQTFADKFGLAGLTNHAASAMSAGLLYSLITMPLETTKNRMAFQKVGPDGTKPYKNMVSALGKIAKTEGVASLWHGFLPYYGRCGGHTVTMFIAVEQLRAAYMKATAGEEQ